MSTRHAVRRIRERSMERVLAEQDADRAAAMALAGLWDAVEVLSTALDADAADRAVLDRLVRSLPERLARLGGDAATTAVVAERLSAVVRLRASPSRASDVDRAARGPGA